MKNRLLSVLGKKSLWLALAAGIAVFALGRLSGGDRSVPVQLTHEKPAKSETIWTCSMHPQIHLPEPGPCPICGMDLIPQEDNSDEEAGLREVSVSETAAKLMRLETTPVEHRFVEAEVRLTGEVHTDETRVSSITAWLPGRLDRLFVDYTGGSVRKGDPMVSIYSPELLSAQQELLQAIESAKRLKKSDLAVIREAAKATVEASREKLRLWGLTAEQVQAIETRGTLTDQVTLTAPVAGIVIHKNAQEGQYVKTGDRIYTVADLSRVWVDLDAYESDLAWLREGQDVAFTTEAVPGETFTGKIDFIHPVLDPATRTVKVRVQADNADGRLKPGTFVRAVVQAATTPDGSEAPLVIPASAPLLTGKRAVVYVAVPGKEGTYEGREVVLGARAGDFYLVREGLREGEQVVTHGAFKLDAELQLRAKPSMMTPEGGGGGGMAGMHHGGEMKDHSSHE